MEENPEPIDSMVSKAVEPILPNVPESPKPKEIVEENLNVMQPKTDNLPEKPVLEFLNESSSDMDDSDDNWFFVPESGESEKSSEMEKSFPNEEKSSDSEISKETEAPTTSTPKKEIKCRECSVFISTKDQQNCKLYSARVVLHNLCDQCPAGIAQLYKNARAQLNTRHNTANN